MRKGQINMVLVGAILAIAFLGVMSLTFNKFTDVVVFDDVSDSYCKNKLAAISSKSEGETGDALENFFNINALEFQRKCKTQEEVIDPNYALTSCPTEVISMTSNTIQSTENCVIYKILTLARRCWEMNGAGTIDGYNWACFNTIIGESERIDSNVKIRERLNSIFQCGSENAGQNCNSLKSDALSDAQLITVYNAYLENNKAITNGKLFSCLNNGANYNGANLTINLVSGDTVINEPAFDEWYKDIIENYYSSVPSRFIDPYINYSTSRGECYKSNFTSILNTILTNTTNAQLEHTSSVDNIRAKFCNSRIDPSTCMSQDTSIEISAKLSSSLKSHITWPEIRNVMSVAKISGSELTYEDYFEDNLELGNNEAIRESSAFQVTYCDGLLPVWSGIVASYPCGSGKKILLSNDMNAGGARLARESISSSCPILSSIKSIPGLDNSITRSMSSMCEESDFLFDI